MTKLDRRSEQLIKTFDKSLLLPTSVVASSASHRIAYVYRQGPFFRRKYSVGVDATLQAAPGKVLGALRFSPDGKRLAYVARSGSGFTTVVDGRKGAHYQRLYPETLRFSPDSSRVGVLAITDRGCSWIIDDVEDPTSHTATGELVFSPDGTNEAYVAVRDKRQIVVRNGQEVGEHDQVLGLVFSPNGDRFAYVAQDGKTMCVVLDGEPRKSYGEIDSMSLRFSPDSQRFAYSATAAGKQLVVVDDIEAGPYDQMPTTPGFLTFSPDSRRVAYGAREGSKFRAIVDGEDFGEADNLVIHHHMALGPAAGSVFTFSPDSRQVVYLAEIGRRSVVVLNGERQPHDLSRFTHSPIFSPNSQRLAYAGVEGATPLVVVDGAGFRPDHEPIGSALFFSPDSTHLAYMAARDTEQFAVVDFVESKPFGPMRFDEADIVFDSPRAIRFLVMRDWDVLLVRDRILRADGGPDYAEAGHASERSALDRAHPKGSKREPQGEPAWKRWIHALLGLGLGIVVLSLAVVAVLFVIYAEDMHMLIVSLIALLGCLWMLGACIRLLAGRRADGGLFSANTRRTILWVQRGLAALAVGGSVVRFLLGSS